MPGVEIEPPVGDLSIGLARPRTDRLGQAVLERFGVGGEPVGAAAVEPETARQRSMWRTLHQAP